MHKLHRAAVVAAVLGSVGLLGAGTAYAGGSDGYYSRTQQTNENSYRQQSSGGHHGKHRHKVEVRQFTSCRAYDKNVDVLGETGLGDGLWGLLHGHEGRPGFQSTRMGSSKGCNNIVRL